MKHRWLLLLTIYAVLIGGGWALGHWFSQWAGIDARPIDESEIGRMVMAVLAVYVVASATPFVPGAEIGFGLIVVLGARIAPLVYLCMVLALVLAYCMGRFVPARASAAIFGGLGLEQARDIVLRTAELDTEDRISMMIAHSPRRFVPFLLKHRYIALALALNTPGNSLVGGGGGLAFAAGMSGLFPAIPFIATAALAAAPIPVFILLTGYQP